MHRLLSRAAARAAHLLALLGFAGLLVLSIMVVADILLRSLADFPLQGVNDVSAMAMAVVIAACIPQALRMRQSIRSDILGQSLGGRFKLGFDAFASLATLVFFSLLAWRFFPYAASLTASGERAWVLHWPVGPWRHVAACFFTVSTLVQALVVFNDIDALVRGHHVAADHVDAEA